MNKVIGLVLAAVVGGLIVWAFQSPTGDDPAADGEGESVAATGAAEEVDATNPEGAATPAVGSGESAPSLAGLPPPRARFRGDLPTARPQGGTTSTSGAAGSQPSPGVSVDDELAIAEAAFQAGDTAKAERRWRQIFATGKRSGTNLVPVVEKLLEREGDSISKREYLEYLQDRPGGEEVFQRYLDRLSEEAAGDDKAAAQRVWSDLTLAYEAAADRRRRRDVLDILQPFLERQIFSKRFSALLTNYAVQPGDNLTKIASRFQTTPDAIKRLNSLTTDVIQPRQRLRVLAGRVEVRVDKSDFRLWVKVGGNFVLERPVGLGVDNATPVGRFEIRVRQTDPTWFRPGHAPLPAGSPGNILGTRWLGFRDTDEFSGYGIHGTSDPSSIGKESSAGCIRLTNDDIELLYDFVPRGTLVIVEE